MANTIVVMETINSPQMTKKEFKEFLKVYAVNNPRKYKIKFDNGEFDEYMDTLAGKHEAPINPKAVEAKKKEETQIKVEAEKLKKIKEEEEEAKIKVEAERLTKIKNAKAEVVAKVKTKQKPIK